MAKKKEETGWREMLDEARFERDQIAHERNLAAQEEKAAEIMRKLKEREEIFKFILEQLEIPVFFDFSKGVCRLDEYILSAPSRARISSPPNRVRWQFTVRLAKDDAAKEMFAWYDEKNPARYDRAMRRPNWPEKEVKMFDRHGYKEDIVRAKASLADALNGLVKQVEQIHETWEEHKDLYPEKKAEYERQEAADEAAQRQRQAEALEREKQWLLEQEEAEKNRREAPTPEEAFIEALRNLLEHYGLPHY